MDEDLTAVEVDDAMPEGDQTAIRSLGNLADLPPSWAEGQIDGNVSLAEARAAARSELARRSAATPRIRAHVGPSNDDPAVILERRAEALAVRMGGGTPSDAARPYVGDRLVDHAAALLRARGETLPQGASAEVILTRAAQHTTSDFPALMSGAGNRTLLASYTAAASPIRALARQTTRSDFRPGYNLRVGELGTLKKVSGGHPILTGQVA